MARHRGRARRNAISALASLVFLGSAAIVANGCGSTVKAVTGGGTGGTGLVGSAGPAGSTGSGGSLLVQQVVVSAAAPTPRVTTWSLNYWQWMPTYGDGVTGTETPVAALHPAMLRVGGYNNDANIADPFDDAAFDKVVAYARAVGAEPILQVPHLADVDGNPPTPATAAAMVTYANVTKGYGIQYWAIGNEPDLYADQGSPTDQTQPAIPGYTPSDYCASVTAYVAAMKAVDPTIKIVGPDLAYKYIPGGGDLDWLTPVLTQCGSLFDVVSIHRYPFEAKQAMLTSAAADPAAFRGVIDSVRGILTATGYGAKPLALTEMNVAYDATACVLDASPGTVGSALWLADSLGTAIDLGLWTSAVWDIADTDDWGLGLIGMPPAHVPRPEYYAYLLFAEHFGPTLASVKTAPSGVSVHASRNQAGDATEMIVINWGGSAAALELQVTGLPSAPNPPTFVVPPVSIAAVEVPDTGPASAWSYGEAQRRTASGPVALTPGVTETTTGAGGGASDGGAGRAVGSGCSGVVCSQTILSSPAITTMGTTSGALLQFGSGAETWGSFTFAAPGQTAPTAAVTPDGDGIQIAGGFTAPVDPAADYEGVGLYFASQSCIDGSAYTGVKFDFSGDLGGCSLQFGATFSGDLSTSTDAARGACAGTAATCYGPSSDVTAAALAATASAPTIEVPFTALSGGMPIGMLDPSSIIAVQWQLGGPLGADAGGCAASFTVSNAAFY